MSREHELASKLASARASLLSLEAEVQAQRRLVEAEATRADAAEAALADARMALKQYQHVAEEVKEEATLTDGHSASLLSAYSTIAAENANLCQQSNTLEEELGRMRGVEHKLRVASAGRRAELMLQRNAVQRISASADAQVRRALSELHAEREISAALRAEKVKLAEQRHEALSKAQARFTQPLRRDDHVGVQSVSIGAGFANELLQASLFEARVLALVNATEIEILVSCKYAEWALRSGEAESWDRLNETA
eukprot:6214074-Pleurochrysis_carterae.AAC.1